MTATSSRVEPPPLRGLLGVLGGMGPLATAFFYQRLVEQTGASVDQDHLPVVIWGDSTIPDRSTALLDDSASDPTPWLRRGAHVLDMLGAELIVVPCNSALPFLRELHSEVSAPILDVVSATVGKAAEALDSGARVAVLSTEGTYRAGVYQQLLHEAGLQMVGLQPSTRRSAQQAIIEIKAGRPHVASRLLHDLRADVEVVDPDAVVAGCTELTVLRDEVWAGAVVIDSATELAAASVARLGPRAHA